jgi:V/A-type H+-transporting ATPase subunit I
MSIINLVPDGTAVKSYYEFVGGSIPTPMGELPFQMLLALGIGVFHICLAMVIKAVGYTKRFGFKENIATWGWTLLIVGGLIVVLLGVGELLSAAAIKWAIIAIGAISALAIYIFNTPGRNPLINVGAGLWDTYNMATGILGDVLSYIRLFALGLAGGMLGAAFNDLGKMVLGDGGVNWVFFLLIIIIGHVLNLLMSCLGAFVHPLRLNFVEYFKNSGYEGKGKVYKPLTK